MLLPKYSYVGASITTVITEGLAGEISAGQEKILNRILQRIDGHIAMISNLLDLSRIEAGCLVQQKERIILPEIIEEVVDLMSQEAEKKGLKFNITINSQVFPVHADRQSMETVLNNLVSNAIKYNHITNSRQCYYWVEFYCIWS